MNCIKEFEKCFSFQLNNELFPSVGWAEELLQYGSNHANTMVLDGSSVTSLDDQTHTYRLVNGNEISIHFDWLSRLYNYEFRELASSAFERPVVCDQSKLSAINMNLLDTPHHSYDWHVDANHCTGLLFLNSLQETSGGALIFRTEDGERSIRPERGKILFFDAREIPHTIEPISGDTVRGTVVMNYNFSDETIHRPEDLDNYLYKT